MLVVVALGGNALIRRGEPMTAENQRRNVRTAAKALAPIATEHQLVIGHGNGPQVGLLALQGAAYPQVAHYPLDILGAETEGMIGYMIEQELGNLLPFERPFATLLTMVEVDPGDPAFEAPAKFIGPVYTKEEANQLASDKSWTFKLDGKEWRRVVPSPRAGDVAGAATAPMIVNPMMHAARRCSALRRMIFWRCSSLSPCVISVSTKPGATEFTFTPMRPTSRASDRVKPSREALVAP